MPLKHLNQFVKFAWEDFARDKLFQACGQQPWEENGKLVGTKVEAVIMRDQTAYTRREGDTRTNRFEKVTFKVAAQLPDLGENFISPVDVEAKVWGDYRNNLSIKAANITVLKTKPAQ